MKVLFVRTGINLEEDFSFYSMGVASISAVIKKAGHETSFFYLEKWEMLNALYHRIDTFKPDVIGFSSPSCTFNVFVKLSKLIKKRDPKIFLILGGFHATLCPEESISKGSFDAISLGEGEYSLLETLEKFKTSKKWYEGIKGMWFKVGDKVVKNPNRGLIEDLNELPDPDWGLFLKEDCLFSPDYGDGKRMEFMMARGCPFDCFYCSNNAIKKFNGCIKVRHVNTDRAINQIKKAREMYRLDYIIFDDDILTYDRDWSIEFLTRYKKEIGLPFECNVRVGPFASKEMLTLLKQAGCVEVKFGVESGNQEIRDKILNRKMSNKQIIEMSCTANKLGLKTAGYIMIGLPEESPKKFLDTIRLVIDSKIKTFRFTVFYPYQNTKLYDYCLEKKYFDFSRKNVTELHDTVLNLPTFKRKDILYFYKNLYKILEFRKPQKSKLKKIYRLLSYQLFLIYPSHWFYFGSKFLLILLRSPIIFLNVIRGMIHE